MWRSVLCIMYAHAVKCDAYKYKYKYKGQVLYILYCIYWMCSLGLCSIQQTVASRPSKKRGEDKFSEPCHVVCACCHRCAVSVVSVL